MCDEVNNAMLQRIGNEIHSLTASDKLETIVAKKNFSSSGITARLRQDTRRFAKFRTLKAMVSHIRVCSILALCLHGGNVCTIIKCLTFQHRWTQIIQFVLCCVICMWHALLRVCPKMILVDGVATADTLS